MRTLTLPTHELILQGPFDHLMYVPGARSGSEDSEVISHSRCPGAHRAAETQMVTATAEE